MSQVLITISDIKGIPVVKCESDVSFDHALFLVANGGGLDQVKESYYKDVVKLLAGEVKEWDE